MKNVLTLIVLAVFGTLIMGIAIATFFFWKKVI
jgi:hypothetical protein